MKETQASVSEWAETMFGKRDLEYRALMVLEEAIELCAAANVPPERVATYFKHVAAKVEAQIQAVGLGDATEEAADTLSTLYAFASTMGFDIHTELDRKMNRNRIRPKSYYDYKNAQKARSLQS